MVDLVEEGLGELAGWYFGTNGWLTAYAIQRYHDNSAREAAGLAAFQQTLASMGYATDQTRGLDAPTAGAPIPDSDSAKRTDIERDKKDDQSD